MGFDKVSPITKHEIDENESFSHFRSYITFYYYLLIVIRPRYQEKNNIDLCIINNKNKKYIKTLFELFYKTNKYFELFYSTFFIQKDILVFTHYNNIPLNFFPYPKQFYYYFPYLTFYGNDKFYTNQEIKFDDKPTYPFVLAHTFKQDKQEVQPTIPLEYLADYVNSYLSETDYFIIFRTNDGTYIMSQNVSLTINSSNKSNNKILKCNKYYSKKNHKYYKFFHKTFNIPLKNIVYASILLPITRQDINNVFKIDVLKKDSIFYNLRTHDNTSLKKIWFAFLYPKVTPFKFDKDPKCMRIKLKKDIKVLNLVVDTFYNNEIVNKEISKNEKINTYLDLSDENYQKEEQNTLFRCINYDDKLKKRKHLCNFTKRNYNFLSKDHKLGYDQFYHKGQLRSNKGKEALSLLLYKNKYINEPKQQSYNIFMDKFQIKFFVNHYGYYIENDSNDKKTQKNIFFDTELYINNNILDIYEYFKLYDDKKGLCVDLYKKGKL